MGYINEALKRASIQSLREYFLYGVNEDNYSAKSYEIRIEKAYEKWRDVVKKYDEDIESSELYSVFSDVLTEHEHVYMELGLQAGFKLAREIEVAGEDEEKYVQYKEMYTSLFEDVSKVIEELKRAQSNTENIYIES